MRQFTRNPLAQPRDEFFGSVVSETGENDLLQLASLRGDGGGDSGIGVTMKIDPPG